MCKHSKPVGIVRMALCIRRTLCRHVTIGTPMAILAVLTVFWLFLTIGTLLVHCWCSLARHVTIGTPMVLTVFDDWYSVPIVKNSQKQSKAVKTVRRQSKQQKWPLVYKSSHVYQDCTNSVPTVYQSSKTVKNSQKTEQQELPLVYQSSHVYTESAEYTKPVRIAVTRRYWWDGWAQHIAYTLIWNLYCLQSQVFVTFYVAFSINIPWNEMTKLFFISYAHFVIFSKLRKPSHYCVLASALTVSAKPQLEQVFLSEFHLRCIQLAW